MERDEAICAHCVQCAPPWQYTTYGCRNGPSADNSAVDPLINVPSAKTTGLSYPDVAAATGSTYDPTGEFACITALDICIQTILHLLDAHQQLISGRTCTIWQNLSIASADPNLRAVMNDGRVSALSSGITSIPASCAFCSSSRPPFNASPTLEGAIHRPAPLQSSAMPNIECLLVAWALWTGHCMHCAMPCPKV
jgi:hypothetical protein